MKKQGYEPVGVSLKLPVWENKSNKICDNMSCTEESIDLAGYVCKKLKVPHYIYDIKRGLCLLSQKQLKYLMFPIGNSFKSEVFEIAKKEGLKYLKRKRKARISVLFQTNHYIFF